MGGPTDHRAGSVVMFVYNSGGRDWWGGLPFTEGGGGFMWDRVGWGQGGEEGSGIVFGVETTQVASRTTGLNKYGVTEGVGSVEMSNLLKEMLCTLFPVEKGNVSYECEYMSSRSPC